MPIDQWLHRWMVDIARQAAAPTILELGCSRGRDTAVLVENGFTRITATDLSRDALLDCARAVPEAQLVYHDLREPLPFAEAQFDVIIASLCLHYFSWKQTQAMVREIRRCLIPGGLFLCRLNSTKDVHYGAIGYPEIEHHYYDVDGEMKRFFDADDVASLFDTRWRRIAVEEMTITRYDKPKTVWEVVANKN